jgi:hypothetical protein
MTLTDILLAIGSGVVGGMIALTFMIIFILFKDR